MNDISLSIITVSYNDLENLKKTVKSVLSQSYENIEYIIIDGNSNDGSKKFLETIEDKRVKWISEKDKGLYDAMNKGSNLANGDFVIFLNAGDLFTEDKILEKVVKKISNKERVYFTRAKVVGEDVEWIYPKMSVDVSKWIKKYLPNHQSMLFPKQFYKSYKYDLKLKTTADIDYKLASKKYGFEFIDEIMVEFQLGGVSTKCFNFNETIDKIKELIYRDFQKNFRLRGGIDIIKTVSKSVICNVIGYNSLLKIIKKFKGYE